MKNILLSVALVFSLGSVSNKVEAGVGEPTHTIVCANAPGICSAIIGQVPVSFSGWAGGCLVLSGTPVRCILR